MAAATATNRVAAQTQGQTPPVDLDRIVKATEARMLERPELLQMRMENESIMSECRVRPRDLEAIKDELLQQLQAFPDLAQDAIYNKPVGKDQDTGQMKYARGLSVRAAEALAEVYGYNRVRSDVTPLEDGKAKVEATFTDFQKGRIWQDGGVVSQYYKDRHGRNTKTPDDRFYSLVCKAEASKRVREVILRSVNTGLKAWFYDECEKMIDSLLDDKTVDKIVGQFSGIKVSLEMLERFVGRARALGWTKDDRKKLLGIWNALKDGETTVGEVFGDPAEKQPAANGAAKDGPVKASDLSTPTEATNPVAEPTGDTLFPTAANAQEA